MSSNPLHRPGKALSMVLSIILLMALFALLTACGNDSGEVGGGVSATPPVAPARASLSFDGPRIFRFSWTDTRDATHYRLLEDSDGLSGYTQVGDVITQGTQTVDHYPSRTLYNLLNARYILQSCNARGCNDDNPIFVSGTLAGAIGYFKASNTGAGDSFGLGVSLSGDGNTLAVGAIGENSNSVGINSTPNDDGTAILSGAVYVYTRSGGAWIEQAYIKASNTGAGDVFGFSVSLSDDGNTLAVGAGGEDSNTIGINSTPNDDGTANESGAVYVFTRSGTVWAQQAYIKSSNPGVEDLFGYGQQSVSLSGDGNTLAVGAPGEDSNSVGINSIPNDDITGFDSGAVYVFSRNGTIWTQLSYIKPLNNGAEDWFGFSINLSGDGNTLAVGATGENSSSAGFNPTPNDDGTANSSGAVYVFIHVGASWLEQEFIKPHNTGAGDRFGYSVSLNNDGNTLAVGATQEESNSTGIDSTSNDDGTASASGAAYVFIRRPSTAWLQQAYVKPLNNGQGDLFGSTVSLSGDGNTLVVGAPNEDSNTTGINSTPNDASNKDGAVYVIARDGISWDEKSYIKASNTEDGDSFGTSVSLSGDSNTLAVGASNEDSNSTGINSTPNDDGTADDSGAVYLY